MSDTTDLTSKITDLCADHPLSPEARALVVMLRIAIEQWPRLDPESRAALRKYVERDMRAVESTK